MRLSPWALIPASLTLCAAGMSAQSGGDRQAVSPPEHVWSPVGPGNRASVDWTTLEHQYLEEGGGLLLIWSRVDESGGSVLMKIAVRCEPSHAAVVQAHRQRDNGTTEDAGPVSLPNLAWRDPVPHSALADIMHAVCAHTRDERVKPC